MHRALKPLSLFGAALCVSGCASFQVAGTDDQVGAQDLQLTFDARKKQFSFGGYVVKLRQFKERYMSYLSGKDTDSSASNL